MDSLTVGPLVFPVKPVLFLAAVLIALAVGNRLAKRGGTDVEHKLWAIVLAGIASARLSFVLDYGDGYWARPWTIFDIRDGGFNTVAGIAGAVLAALLLAARNRAQRGPILVSLLTGLTLWGATSAALQAARPDTPLPAISLPNLEGDAVSLQSFKGKPVVINLWASWCPPCRREMPALQKAQQAHEDVVFVFANQGESVDAVQAYIDAQGLRLENVLLDRAGAVAKHAGAAGMPTTLFFDREGNLVDTRVGELAEGSLEQRIKPLRKP